MSHPRHGFGSASSPPPQVSLRRVDRLVSGVLMAVVVGILYGRPIEPHFGTTPAPAEYMTVSEAAIDLEKYLRQDKYWYTDDLNSPHRSLLPQEYKQQSKGHLVKAYP